MTTRVYLVRHGATALSAEDRFAGETDVALSDAGREQAGRLAARLAEEPVAAFYASPLSRTMETARILAKPHSRDVLPREGLREISHGHWEGKRRADVERLYTEEYTRWEADPFSFAPAGGETGLAVIARAAGSSRDRRGAPRRPCPPRLTQGHDPFAAELPA
jgi:broad specificity phosphatase PhoE